MTTITANRQALANAADFAARVLPTKPSHPAMSGILVEPMPGAAVRLAASNYEHAAQAVVDAEVSAKAQPLLLPGALLAGWLNTARGSTVTLTLDEQRVTGLSGGARITMPALDPTTAPGRPTLPDDAPRLTLPRTALADALRRVAGAVSTDPMLAALNAVHLVTREGRLEVSATNRYIIARVVVPLDTPPIEFEAEPLHRVLFDLLGKIDGPEVSLAVAGDVLHVEGATTSASLRLLAERFKWEALDGPLGRMTEIPDVATVTASALAQEATALGKLSALAGGKNKYLRITAQDGQATVGLYGVTDLEAASAPIEWAGDPLHLSISADFLLTGLAVVGTEQVHIGATAPQKPVRFSSPESTGVAVVMPLRTDN